LFFFCFFFSSLVLDNMLSLNHEILPAHLLSSDMLLDGVGLAAEPQGVVEVPRFKICRDEAKNHTVDIWDKELWLSFCSQYYVGPGEVSS
jgi:hypothetical protein